MMNLANELFLESLNWLRASYERFTFYVERDVVWTIQQDLITRIRVRDLPLSVFNDYPICKVNRHSIRADLVILSRETQQVEVAVEFKYEPSHKRTDIPKSKFPVVDWKNEVIGKDTTRIRKFVEDGLTPMAYALLIDEGNTFSHYDLPIGSKWQEWNENGALLMSRVASDTVHAI